MDTGRSLFFSIVISKRPKWYKAAGFFFQADVCFHIFKIISFHTSQRSVVCYARRLAYESHINSLKMKRKNVFFSALRYNFLL